MFEQLHGASSILTMHDKCLREQLITDQVLEQSFAWLCHQRRHWPPDADVWCIRSQWQSVKHRLVRDLGNGTYRFDPMSRITKANGDIIHVWSARDALVLKALAIVLGNVLPLSSCCTHIKGHGGANAAIRAVADALPTNTFVMRTDVKSFYESIDQYLLIDALAAYVDDRFVLNLLWQVMRRSVTWGGLYKDCERGISRGCPLSPLLSGFVLYELDKTFQKGDTFYVRFMDDILILAPTRWKLRRAIKQVNTELTRLNLAQHPDKTFIGRISKGFDFLGYHFSPVGLTVAQATVERFIEKANRLYEQEPHSRALGLYVRRWLGWALPPLLCAKTSCESRPEPLTVQRGFLALSLAGTTQRNETGS